MAFIFHEHLATAFLVSSLATLGGFRTVRPNVWLVLQYRQHAYQSESVPRLHLRKRVLV